MRVTHRSQKFSKIKIRTSSPCKAHLGSYDDEVRILFFDDPAEEKQSKRPVPRYPDSVPPVYSFFPILLYKNGVYLIFWILIVNSDISLKKID